MNTIKITLLNLEGGGFSDLLEVAQGTTVGALFDRKFGPEQAPRYVIRVNNRPVVHQYVLQEGDKVSFTPRKIEGAVA